MNATHRPDAGFWGAPRLGHYDISVSAPLSFSLGQLLRSVCVVVLVRARSRLGCGLGGLADWVRSADTRGIGVSWDGIDVSYSRPSCVDNMTQSYENFYHIAYMSHLLHEHWPSGVSILLSF